MKNQETKILTNSIWTKAINLAQTLDELDYIEKKLETTRKINRRTKEGRELTLKIRQLITNKAYQLIKEGAVPFE